MPTLFLLRHAKSDWSDHGAADIDRPLSSRGERAAALIAQAIADRDLIPDLVLCSPARRTRETLAALQPVLGNAVPVRITEGLYEPASGNYRAIVEEESAGAERLMVIGHNPAIHATATLFAGKGDAGLLHSLSEKFPTGALAVIDFKKADWPEPRPQTGRLSALILPRTLATKAGEVDED
jgi:phosphohistidine phosphatase